MSSLKKKTQNNIFRVVRTTLPWYPYLSVVISLQMALRMEEIRALLQNMNNQQQQQHQHTHSHLSPTDSPPQGDHTHSHGHSHGAEPGGEGLGGAGPLDMRSVLKLLQTSGVFFILLLLRFVYDHCLGEGVEFLLLSCVHWCSTALVWTVASCWHQQEHQGYIKM